MPTPEELLAKAAAMRTARERRLGIAPEQVAKENSFYEDTLADLQIPKPQRAPEAQALDQLIAGLTVEQAYRKFVTNNGKRWEQTKSGGKERMIRCPSPYHIDTDPSASVNSEGTWKCHGTCDYMYGDAIAMAAAGLGMNMQNYQDGQNFVRLREQIGEAFGLRKIPRAPGQKEDRYIAPTETTVITPLAPIRDISTAPSAPLTEAQLSEIIEESDPDHDFIFPSLRWREFVPEDTFLWEYMCATTELPYPDEYDFWNAMVAVGFVLGHEVYFDDQPRAYANLFLCTIGRTGEGKSEASRIMKTMVREVLPYEKLDFANNGVHHVPTPNSDVFLIQQFDRRIPHETDPKKEDQLPVRGLVDFSEMIGLMGKMRGEHGGKFQAVLEDFYDNVPVVNSGAVGSGVSSARDAYCSVIATTQLKEIKNLLTASDAGSGLLNRFIFPMGPSRERKIMRKSTYDPTEAYKRFKEIKAFWSIHPGGVTLNDEAFELLDTLWEERGADLKRSDTSDMLARLDLTIKKLMLLLAANSKLEVITPTIVRQAFAVLDYVVATYRAVSSRIGISKQTQAEERISGIIKRYQETHGGIAPTCREVTQRAKPLSSLEVGKIITGLCSMDILAIEETTTSTGKSGRTSPRYRYVS